MVTIRYCPLKHTALQECILDACGWYVASERRCAVAVQAKALRLLALRTPGEVPARRVHIDEDTMQPIVAPASVTAAPRKAAPRQVIYAPRRITCAQCGKDFEVRHAGRATAKCPARRAGKGGAS